jgi:hypothetical protein
VDGQRRTTGVSLHPTRRIHSRDNPRSLAKRH